MDNSHFQVILSVLLTDTCDGVYMALGPLITLAVSDLVDMVECLKGRGNQAYSQPTSMFFDETSRLVEQNRYP